MKFLLSARELENLDWRIRYRGGVGYGVCWSLGGRICIGARGMFGRCFGGSKRIDGFEGSALALGTRMGYRQEEQRGIEDNIVPAIDVQQAPWIYPITSHSLLVLDKIHSRP